MTDDISRGGVLVHEWLEPTGGSENVFEAMAAAFPEARILTPWNNAPHRFAHGRVTETWLARTPIRRSKAAAALALPAVWRSRGLAPDAAWALISSHMFAHHIRLPVGAQKLVYVHTPARYVWSPELDARGSGVLARTASVPLRAVDRHRALEATTIAANSRYVQQRIRRHWGREADVIHPPVDVERVRTSVEQERWRDAEDGHVLDGLPSEFLLGVSRFVSYKRLAEVISAGESLRIPVVIAGAGPDEAALREQARAASVPVEIVLHPSSDVLYELYRRARALVFPAVEDFGIVPVEAMSVGTPVVGVRAGGLLETVEDGVSGVLVDALGDQELRRALDVVDGLRGPEVSAVADRFAAVEFRNRLTAWVSETVADRRVPA